MCEPQIQIIEQPAPTIRYRYETEGNYIWKLDITIQYKRKSEAGVMEEWVIGIFAF